MINYLRICALKGVFPRGTLAEQVIIRMERVTMAFQMLSLVIPSVKILQDFAKVMQIKDATLESAVDTNPHAYMDYLFPQSQYFLQGV